VSGTKKTKFVYRLRSEYDSRPYLAVKEERRLAELALYEAKKAAEKVAAEAEEAFFKARRGPVTSVIKLKERKPAARPFDQLINDVEDAIKAEDNIVRK
jgi:methionine synthase I (cobalamin-dependent)